MDEQYQYNLEVVALFYVQMHICTIELNFLHRVK